MLLLLNTYLVSLNLHPLHPTLWNYLKDQLTYPEMELEVPVWQWLKTNTTVTKKTLYSHLDNNSFSLWIQDRYSSIPIITHTLTDQQAKNIIDFLRENKDYLQ